MYLKEKFLLASLVQWMNEQYVGLYSSSTSFRAHEFEKHGTCTLEANQMSTRELENHYFGQIQKLNQKYDLISALNKGGIYASDDKSYTYQEIVAALKNGFEDQSDYDVKIQCLTVDDTIYLGAIDLYLDLDFNLGKDLCAASKSEMVTSFNMCSQSKPIFFPKFDWKQVSE
ncbi:Ribonuclease T2-like protein [Pseudocohnilembus persalinus]|uniref:Ribonuclease T2-like protein n=1 Tax=Pseudocohnilembus persalinus TaxID=266149 RepID=A0A0V0QQK0_PSEPJ|nr:Ribonuclease T2-like protein [Pseudocohnilembus persalinus]|eukprot:KRX04296.1 Ribonuclease T2-like protein [Pseudocohnilembus persalinus]